MQFLSAIKKHVNTKNFYTKINDRQWVYHTI